MLTDGHVHMQTGDFFGLRRFDLWPTLTPGHFEGRAHELTDSSQEYFYTVVAIRLDNGC